MQINFTGGSKSQRKHTEKILRFCKSKLMPRMHSLELNIRLRDFGKDESYGYCIPTDYADAARPREFDIDINKKIKLRRLLETVAHEFVHVKQFARGELYESGRTNKHRWKGKWLPKEPTYWDQPWEIEAHGREIGLFIRYCEAEGLAKKHWVLED
jgi:hypothetical protein|tara:strand:- start:3019 stop:3486 length:468 start_codon:yes stop_codon:yes gene_type:complete